MRVSDATVEQILLSANKIKKDDLKRLEEQVKTEKKPLQDIAVKNNIVTEKEFAKLYAEEFNYPFVEISPEDVRKDIIKLIPEKFARQYNVLLLDKAKDGSFVLAMEDPDNIQAVDFLKKQLGSNIEIKLACHTDILTGLDQYRENISSEISDVITEADDDEGGEEVDEADIAEDSPIAQTVNLIIEYAVKTSSSDIHIEPHDKYVSVRYRQDGVLKEGNKLPKKVDAALVSRIKILANLKIDERRAPQDGRFKININGRIFAFRVSVMPVVNGEKVVMRVLDESSEPPSLEQLGLWGVSLERLNAAIREPHGMILVTGPTGSGKSTTLHSVLNILNQPGVNISTIEDPVEYKLEGTNQTQVNPKAGMTFAGGLRALLRQDPNIIMVGEVRDTETGGLCVQAALTGHLVFSTLHTNNAATCLPRLLDMKIEPFLIASTVRAVVGQRLVRRVNPDECEQYTPDANELKGLEKTFSIDGEAGWKHIFELTSQVNSSVKLNSTKDIKLWRPQQKLEHGQTGYKGRQGIYEVLINSPDVQKMITAGATSEDLNNQAIKEGMVTMFNDGLIRALAGQTSIEEVLRVTRD